MRESLPFDFASPWYLLLLALSPFIYLWWRSSLAGLSPARRKASLVLRAIVILLLVLALAELRWVQVNRRLAVFFVVDRSESIPAEQREAARQYVIEASRSLDAGRDDMAGVVAFGRTAGIEISPKAEPLELQSFVTLVEPDATDMASAIRLASAAFPEGAGKRIVILSDGNENRGNAIEEARIARSQGVTVDVVPITYSYPAEISIDKVLVDPQLDIGQPFDIRVVVDSTVETEAVLRLYENEVHIPQGDPVVKLKPGKNVLDFRGRRLESPGRYYYEARIEPVRPENDAVIQNNAGFAFTFIEGEPQVLIAASEPELEEPLAAALRNEKIQVRLIATEQLPVRIEEYFNYDAIIVSNIAAHEISDDQMKLLESLVKGLGIGFVMLGGEKSFGAGGYQGTPIERLLPVDMEIKQRKVLPNGALAMVVHSCELGNGNYWARQVIQRALRILSPRDYAGVLYHDDMSGEKWLFRMTPVAQRQAMLSSLANFNPGDMMSFHNIMGMALKGLTSTQASIKHMVILSDGDPGMPSAALVSQIQAARITISTICYGAHGSIPPGMQQLAQDGGGKFYYLQDPSKLPEIFIREATQVQKSLISEETFKPLLATRGPILQGFGDDFPPLDGLVITSPKELATMHLLRPPGEEDPTQDPLLASWNYGLGKSIAFTSDAGRRWGKNWTGWSGYGRFWSQCIRWVSRFRSDDRFRVSRRVQRDVGAVTIDAITPDGRFINDAAFQGNLIGPDLEAKPVDVRQVAPGRYTAEFPVEKKGTYTVALTQEKDGKTATHVTAISIPYSPEYRILSTDHDLLRRVAEAGGGRYHDPPPEPHDAGFFSRDFPTVREVSDAWRQLLVLAIALFYLDVFIRRVVVDYREVLTLAIARVRAAILRRKPAVAPADARLATLLERKSRLREDAHARYTPPEPAAGAPRASAAPEPAVRPAVRAAAPRPEAEPEAVPGGSGSNAPAEVKAPEPEGYTARLLEAKRRALRRDGPGGTEKDRE